MFKIGDTVTARSTFKRMIGRGQGTIVASDGRDVTVSMHRGGTFVGIDSGILVKVVAR
jgi:acyl dehydratase